ncbi:MAG TPA: 2Fe-2S iron-sulfur cluster-binding protein, partial [Gaiellaceae bacterium]|nr:2Fe-2S iron-sulfur cluster-binding protein [Gaiellaceae bacterium]
IDREHPIKFRYAGKELTGFAGDTIGSALYAAGRRVFSRSFKYHRPRGLLCCSGHCPNCMMTVDGVPNVRVCVEPLRPDVDVRDQNVRGSADRDLLGVVDKVGGPFTPVGFYYRTMIRPRRLWPLYEKVLRNLAGLGRVDEKANGHGRYDTVHRRVDVLVIGGGPAGRAAAAAAQGEVLLVDDREPHEASYDVLAPATALAIYEGGLVPVAEGNVLHRIRAGRIVVATGALEQPLLFPGNDLVGVLLPDAVRRMVDDWALGPGERAVLVGEGTLGVREQLARAGVEIAATSLRPESLSARGRRGRLRAVELDGITYDCDLLVVSGGLQPAYSLLAQAGARIEYEPRRGIFVPTELPAGIDVVGAAAGEIEQSPAPGVLDGHGDKCFVCICEDVTTKDVKRALREGFDSIELAKRYTTVTMGPCQGKLCQLASTRLLARETDTDESAIGTTTARPPWRPVELGLLAGPHHEPAKLTPLHSRHEALGAEVIWTGAWPRAFHYGDPAAEVRAVHESLGVIDVSTLGKVIVEGSGAAELLDRLYP